MTVPTLSVCLHCGYPQPGRHASSCEDRQARRSATAAHGAALSQPTRSPRRHPMPDLASITQDAYYNRRTAGEATPTDAELDALAERVERLNRSGPTDGFIDAQADLIDALLVRLDVLRKGQS